MRNLVFVRRRLPWTCCAALVAVGMWATTSMQSALAVTPTSPADKSCTGPGAGGSVHPGQTDTCTVTVSASGTGFFNSTAYTLTLTGPTGAIFTGCTANASFGHVTSFTATTCNVTPTASAAPGTVLVTEVISIALATPAGSAVSQTLAFPGFPGFVVPVSGPGASVSAAVATPTPTPAPTPTPTARAKVIAAPPTGADLSGGFLGAAAAVLVGAALIGIGLVGVPRRRRIR